MDFINTFQNLINQAGEFASSMCVINGSFMTLEEVEGMGWKEFKRRSVVNVPFLSYYQSLFGKQNVLR